MSIHTFEKVKPLKIVLKETRFKYFTRFFNLGSHGDFLESQHQKLPFRRRKASPKSFKDDTLFHNSVNNNIIERQNVSINNIKLQIVKKKMRERKRKSPEMKKICNWTCRSQHN